MAREHGRQADAARRRGQVELPEQVAPFVSQPRLTRELTEAELAQVVGGEDIASPILF